MRRASLVHDYPHRMAGHCGSGAMRDLLQWRGLGWGGPPSEGLVFALGGAIGLSYLRSSKLVPPLYLVGRGADFEVDLPVRLGGQVQVLTTDDAGEGWSWVRDEIDAGRPSLVWGDIAELPYLRVQLQMSRHDIVVIGYDEGAGIALVVDNDRAEVQEIPLEALARARSSMSFPQPTRHCTYRITWPDELPAIAEVASAAFRQSADNMRWPSKAGIAVGMEGNEPEGLLAAETFAADVQTWRDMPAEDVAVLLFSVGAFIEKAGTGGGLFRRLLAEGSDEVARLTGDVPTARLAGAAHRSAAAWSETARVAIQRDVDLRTRLTSLSAVAGRLPEVEDELVGALEYASSSLATRRS